MTGKLLYFLKTETAQSLVLGWIQTHNLLIFGQTTKSILPWSDPCHVQINPSLPLACFKVLNAASIFYALAISANTCTSRYMCMLSTTRALSQAQSTSQRSVQLTRPESYKVLVRPTLEYTSTVWSPHLKKEVEKVQQRAARYVSNHYTPMDSPTEMMQSLKWETLEQRRLKSRAVMGYKIVHGLVGIPPDQLVPSTSSTRGHDMKYNTIYGRTDYYRKTSSHPSYPCSWTTTRRCVWEGKRGSLQISDSIPSHFQYHLGLQ